MLAAHSRTEKRNQSTIAGREKSPIGTECCRRHRPSLVMRTNTLQKIFGFERYHKDTLMKHNLVR